MVRYGKETKLSSTQVIEKAVKFFGPGGVGLEVQDQGPDCARFVGGGGFVSISLCQEEGRTHVDLTAREWDFQAKQFVSLL